MILIVDDEPILRDLLSDLCSELGILCIQSSRPQDVEKIVQSIKIDWVITDIAMPDMNGIELIKNVNKVKPNIKFICISGFAGVLESELSELNVSLVVNKPMNMNKFREQLKQVIKIN